MLKGFVFGWWSGFVLCVCVWVAYGFFVRTSWKQTQYEKCAEQYAAEICVELYK